MSVLHRALHEWQGEGRQALADYLALHAAGRQDALHVVAQAIVSVLPGADEERRMLENYLQGSESLPMARQPDLGLEA